jgi:glycosyltransferase involved in cell wall biosynthesis
MAKQKNERPLITFALFAYNQEKYIREAIEGAFSQTYSPLEIILSDDCSTDNTWRIIEELASSYRGPHRIILNRNSENKGIGRHVERIAELSHGEWVVMAAGDDISMPYRVARIFEVARTRPNIYSVGHHFSVINDHSIPVVRKGYFFRKRGYVTPLELIRSGFVGQHGAALAYKRELFNWPYSYPVECWFEDQILQFRATVRGGFYILDESLCCYRCVSENTDAKKWSSVTSPFFINMQEIAINEAKRCLKLAVEEQLISNTRAKSLFRAINRFVAYKDELNHQAIGLEKRTERQRFFWRKLYEIRLKGLVFWFKQRFDLFS